jgi:hypothetical protein
VRTHAKSGRDIERISSFNHFSTSNTYQAKHYPSTIKIRGQVDWESNRHTNGRTGNEVEIG